MPHLSGGRGNLADDGVVIGDPAMVYRALKGLKEDGWREGGSAALARKAGTYPGTRCLLCAGTHR